MNIQQMMKQAAKMQDQVQKQAAQARAEGTAGGGAVTVVINGLKQIQSLKIDPEVVSKDDVEILQDMIVAAFVEEVGDRPPLVAARESFAERD